MNVQLEAAYEIHQFFSAQKIPYAIIGGLAVQYWGEPRFTRDVDATILVASINENRVVEQLLKTFTPRIPEAAQFARKNRIILVKNRRGCDLDISLGLPGYEEEVVARAVNYDIGDKRTIKLCSAEDLIIHKAIAGRPQDCFDIEGIIFRQGKKLDVDYILRRLKNFSQLLETEEALQRFTKPWKKFLETTSKQGNS